MENATITVYQTPTGYDDTTGYKTEDDTPAAVLRDVPCTFAPERTRSRRNTEGVNEMTQTVPSVLVETEETLRTGMVADVTPDGGDAVRYTIARAVRDSGISGAEWILELEAVTTP